MEGEEEEEEPIEDEGGGLAVFIRFSFRIGSPVSTKLSAAMRK